MPQAHVELREMKNATLALMTKPGMQDQAREAPEQIIEPTAPLAENSVSPRGLFEQLLELEGRLENTATRRALQLSPQAIAEAAAECAAPIAHAVTAAAGVRVVTKPEEVERHCAQHLPALIAHYSPRFGAPLAHFVLSLTDSYISEAADAELRVRAALSKKRSEQVSDPDPASAPVTEAESAAEAVLDLPALEEEAAFLEGALANLDQPLEEVLAAEDSPADLIEAAASIDRELQLHEYNSETLRVLLDDLPPRSKIAAELYYLQSFSPEEIGTVIGAATIETRQLIHALHDRVAARHQSEQLASSGNTIRREIERTDLKLNETQGVSLLCHLVREYPRLRMSAALLNLVADSPEFFSDLMTSAHPEVQQFRAALLADGSGVDLRHLGTNTLARFKSAVTGDERLPERVRFDAVLAPLLAVDTSRSGKNEFHELDFRYLGRCIELGFYPPTVHAESRLTHPAHGDSGIRYFRNPLTLPGVVGEEIAFSNSLTLLRRAFPNLDAVHNNVRGYGTAALMLGLSPKASVFEVRRALVENNVQPPQIPENYDPPAGDSAYFDTRCVGEEVERNRDRIIRRRWANLDDPDRDEFMATALGVKLSVEALVVRAAQTLGTTIPHGHSLRYNERFDSRYFNSVFVGSEEKAEENRRIALAYTFGSLAEVTPENIKARVGVLRLARMLGTGTGLKDMHEEIRKRGLLPESVES